MKVTAISDLHGDMPKLGGGDLLIVAGDFTAWDKVEQWEQWWAWINKQPYDHKVYIAGNHDMFLTPAYHCSPKALVRAMQMHDTMRESIKVTYLQDSGTVVDGFKIWGTPWSRWFEGVNPDCTAFMLKSEFELQDRFNLIPEDTDILVSHSPCYCRLDKTLYGDEAGSRALRDRVDYLRTKKLRYHFHGHIHEAYGAHEEEGLKTFNVARMDRSYTPRNKILNIEI